MHEEIGLGHSNVEHEDGESGSALEVSAKSRQSNAFVNLLTISNSKISEVDTDGVPVQDPEHAVHNVDSAASDTVNDPRLAKGNYTHGIL